MANRTRALVSRAAIAAAVTMTGLAGIPWVPQAQAATEQPGYWLLGADGRVHPFGASAYHGDTRGSSVAAVDLSGMPDGAGYVVLQEDCALRAFGSARAVPFGDPRAHTRFVAGDRCTAVALTPDGRGGWVFTGAGRAIPVGSALFYGDMAGTPLNGPVLDGAATPSGRGYYLVGSDGGVFAFGDARFEGSMGGRPLNAPVRAIVPDPDGVGYWLVARDGGVFAFGAAFRGSMGGQRLNRPMSGMVSYGNGYILVAEDGGPFVFSDQPFLGSLGDDPPDTAIVSVAATTRVLPSVLSDVIERTPGTGPGTGGAVQPGEPTAPPVTVPKLPGRPTLTATTFLSGLDTPWDLAFLPDGSLLFTERPGRIRHRALDGTVRTLAEPADVRAAAVGQSGMLGIAVDPAFTTNRFVYTFASSAQPSGAENRVIRWRMSDDGLRLERDRDIVTGIGYRRSGNIGFHSGGALRFGPDGLLYATVGDNYGGASPQDLQALAGKVMRFDRDGNPKGAGLPGAHPLVYTYGHRNPQGISFRPGTGQPYTSEHGSWRDDEVTPLRPGGNGGWNPGPPGYDGHVEMTDTSLPDVMLPAYVQADSQGMAGSTFVTGPQWRDWDGALIVASMAGTKLTVVELDSTGTTTLRTTDLFTELGLRLRSLRQGPDGALYVTVDASGTAGAILRIVPS